MAVDWVDMDHWLISYCVDPKMRRTARASSFSASLELVREGKLELRQDKAFSPIWARARRDNSTQAA
jgi:segregation and condensation protein A